MRATFFWNCRSRRSLRLPKMRVSRLFSMDVLLTRLRGSPWRVAQGGPREMGTDAGPAEPVILTWGAPGRYQHRPGSATPCKKEKGQACGLAFLHRLGRGSRGVR